MIKYSEIFNTTFLFLIIYNVFVKILGKIGEEKIEVLFLGFEK